MRLGMVLRALWLKRRVERAGKRLIWNPPTLFILLWARDNHSRL